MSVFRRRLMMQSSKENFNKVPFYSHALEAGTFTLNLLVGLQSISYIQYSINDPSFSNAFEIPNVDTQTVQVTVPVQEGDVVYWKGCGSRYNNDNPEYNDDVFESTGLYEVGGNLMSLVCPDTASLYANKFPTVIEAYCFRNFFRNETKLMSCDNLVINATTCGEEGCKRLFYGCTSLVNPIKVLPATTLGKQCYHTMFGYCANLVSGPKLPATTLAHSCYHTMFDYCTSLATAPKLPATTLAEQCYRGMFEACTSLSLAPELPATELIAQCYDVMFQGCTSLTTAEIPTIAAWATRACNNMFNGCSELSYVKALIKNIAAYMTEDWMKGVKNEPECIFVKHIDATWTTTGNTGVPTNWTLLYFDPSTEKYYLSDKTTECDDHGNVINA